MASGTTCWPPRAAIAALAFDEAADRLAVALELGLSDPAERAGLMIELGTPQAPAGRAIDALAAWSRRRRSGGAR